MKFVLKSLSIFTLVAVITSLTFIGYRLLNSTVCDRTLTWDIGTFDTQFGLTKQQYIDSIQSAEQVWEKPFGRNLFKYQPGSDFKINLIYDERQALSNKRTDLDKEISSGKETYEQIQNRYQQTIKNYEAKLTRYNATVQSWNQKGGAPADIYGQLELERKRLDEDFQRIKQIESQIQKFSNNINIKVDEYNQQADHTYNKGIYSGQEINIYEFQGQAELKLALTHELGHAVNLGHTASPDSIMYPVLKDQPKENINLTEEDINALKTECKI